MAIVVQSNLSKTVSLLNLDKWSTSARELQGIRIEKPDERHKSLIFINASINPSTCITGASWDFLEEMEDELGDTIMICGDFNARYRVTQTVQSIWYWCPQSLHYGHMQTSLYHTAVISSP